MGEFSLTHLLLFAIILLVFFGPSRLPQLGQSLGKAIRGFKEGLNEAEIKANPTNQRSEETAQLKSNSTGENVSQTQKEKETDKA